MVTEKRPHESPTVAKLQTGIRGLDEITGGGLPRQRTTLVVGGPGTGKTILGLQTLVNGSLRSGEPGIFVACEERSDQIVANAFIDAFVTPANQNQAVHSGQFLGHGLIEDPALGCQ